MSLSTTKTRDYPKVDRMRGVNYLKTISTLSYTLANEDKAFDAIANEPDYRKHQYIKSATEQYRKALRISNPFLDRALQQGDFGISKQETMLRDLKSMLNDPTAPIDEMTRNKLIASTEIVDDSMNYFNYKNSINDPNAVRDKKIYRNNALTDLRKLTAWTKRTSG